MKIPKVLWHYGRKCDCCKRRLTLVCHFGYDTQEEGKSYKMCMDCLQKHINLITFGWMGHEVDRNVKNLYDKGTNNEKTENQELISVLEWCKSVIDEYNKDITSHEIGSFGYGTEKIEEMIEKLRGDSKDEEQN